MKTYTKINPFNLEPCKDCGRRDEPSGVDLKKLILAWAGTKPAVGYSAQMSKIELIAIYKKIQELETKT